MHLNATQITRRLALILLVMMPVSLWAENKQDLTVITQTAQRFLSQHFANMPGQVFTQVSPADPRLNLPPCQTLQAFWPSNVKQIGPSRVAIRCLQGASWTLMLPVNISIVRDVVIAARPLAANTPLGAEDITLAPRELANLPEGIFFDRAEAIGSTPLTSIAKDTPLRSALFRPQFVVLQNQRVRLVVETSGFRVESSGKALNNALTGQVVSVRTDNGRVVQGLAEAGGVVRAATP